MTQITDEELCREVNKLSILDRMCFGLFALSLLTMALGVAVSLAGVLPAGPMIVIGGGFIMALAALVDMVISRRVAILEKKIRGMD